MAARTIQEAKRYGIDFLKTSARDASELLALAINTSLNHLNLSEIVPEESWKQYITLLERRKKGEPLQQIIGFVPFLNCKIEVTQDVLIPRHETEFLADYAIETIKKLPYKDKVLLDLCTGSGCIAIAVKKALPDLKVIAIDISKKALMVAKKNALQNGVSIEFLLGDFLAPLNGRPIDFVISNPPYVTELEYDTLDDSVRLYEPREALVGGVTGLEFYEKMARLLPQILNPHGKVFLEIGSTQGKGVEALFASKPWLDVKCFKDLASHDRFFFLEIE